MVSNVAMQLTIAASASALQLTAWRRLWTLLLVPETGTIDESM
jgi:hypothetical protein